MYLTDQSQSPWVGVPLVAYSMSWANPWKSRDVSFEETNSPSRTFLHRVGYIAGYLRVGIKVVDARHTSVVARLDSLVALGVGMTVASWCCSRTSPRIIPAYSWLPHEAVMASWMSEVATGSASEPSGL